MKNPLSTAEEFIQESKDLGYRIEGSVFKVDYNGTWYTVGFWIGGNWENKKLPGRRGKAKHADFDTAVSLAMEKALEYERKYRD